MTTVKFKRTEGDNGASGRGRAAKMPSYAHGAGDAGMDIFAAEWIVISPNGRALVRTGLKIELEPGFEAQVRSKSGRALKEGLAVLNSPGTIDPAYRGEVGAILVNHSDSTIYIEEGQAIAQLVIAPVVHAGIEEVTGELSESNRGEGGYGSTSLTRA
jgi:dUTP pyrophosphatase